MPNAEFSEDEFEDNLLDELRHIHGRRLPQFKPTRMMENHVGYDFAVSTGYAGLHRRDVYIDDPALAGLLPAQVRSGLPPPTWSRAANRKT
ncbi:MAG: hypothetical protein JWP87_4805 [Labilithrix sp.]|nr:hypothetical protein [Labilithrix sp.]